MSEEGIWQVVSGWFLFFFKRGVYKKLGVIITCLLTETQDTIARMLRSPEAKYP